MGEVGMSVRGSNKTGLERTLEAVRRVAPNLVDERAVLFAIAVNALASLGYWAAIRSAFRSARDERPRD